VTILEKRTPNGNDKQNTNDGKINNGQGLPLSKNEGQGPNRRSAEVYNTIRTTKGPDLPKK
jgi:hypothetical protein